MTITTDNSVAKIGRSMKKWDKVMSPGSSPSCLWLGNGRFGHGLGMVLRKCLLLRIDLGACPHPLHAVHNHPLPRLQTVANHTQTVDHRPKCHLTVLHGVLVMTRRSAAFDRCRWPRPGAAAPRTG